MSDVIDGKGRIKDRITLRERKTNKVKDFPLGETSRKALKEYLDTLDAIPGQALFVSRKGSKAITRQQAYGILNNAARAIGFNDCKHKTLITKASQTPLTPPSP